MRTDTVGALVLAFLANGPSHIPELSTVANCDYIKMYQVLRDLKERGKVIILGHAGKLGYERVRKNAAIYALTGTKLTKRTPEQGQSIKQPCIYDADIATAQPITIGRRMAGWPSNRSRAQ